MSADDSGERPPVPKPPENVPAEPRQDWLGCLIVVLTATVMVLAVIEAIKVMVRH